MSVQLAKLVENQLLSTAQQQHHYITVFVRLFLETVKQIKMWISLQLLVDYGPVFFFFFFSFFSHHFITSVQTWTLGLNNSSLGHGP